jgi:hypothetical protein
MTMNDNENPFPEGVVIFFRMMTTDNNMARSIHPRARQVIIGSRTHSAHDDDYVVADAEGRPLGYYPRDFVSAILPLETVGPGNADNPQKPAHH